MIAGWWRCGRKEHLKESRENEQRGRAGVQMKVKNAKSYQS